MGGGERERGECDVEGDKRGEGRSKAGRRSCINGVGGCTDRGWSRRGTM